MNDGPQPLWLLAELTYACPLQCPYCSNPVDFATQDGELSTDDWLRVLRQARALGATQLGFSGGEPLARRDLDTLIGEARKLGYYSNLITSAVGMDAERVARFREIGLDHIQVSFQASDAELNDLIAGTEAFEHKLEMARAVKNNGFPMVLCFVLHRDNMDRVGDVLELAKGLDADYVELATTQYYGWAWVNRDRLMPSRAQLEEAERVTNRFREQRAGDMKIYYVVPDYYETRPKPCMNGWGQMFLTITPDGTALPCHAARQLPGLSFPNVKDSSVEDIWLRSEGFNRFRGDDWMKEPCRSCPEKTKDFGGCRCQAYMLTGDPANADPVCDKSPFHDRVVAAIERVPDASSTAEAKPLVFRNPRNSKALSKAEA
jgi:pyrroloquinoline quinone biosynthesis protein E